MRPMITPTRLTSLALAAALVAIPAPAGAADFYLKLEGLKGEGMTSTAGAKVREAAARTMAGGEVEILSWSWGASQRSAAAADGDGRADRVITPRDPASGLATGKRQHWPVNLRTSVTLVGNFPQCVVGAAYDRATVQLKGMRYQLSDVVITSCAAAPGGPSGLPTLSLTMSYLKRKLG